MTDENDTTSEVARVLIEHTRIDGIHGDCSCKHVVPLGHSFAAHQAGALAEAGLLRDHVTIDALNQRCQILVDEADGLRAQIATQEPAGEPVAPSGGVGTSGTLSGRLRALILATYADDGYFGVTALEIGEFADEAQRLEVHARVVEQSLRTSRADVERVLEVAQWLRGQGLVGYARKVEEAVGHVDEEHTPEPKHEHKWVFVTTYDARGLAVQQCTIAGCGVKRDMATGGIVLGPPTTNPFRPEDRA